MARRRKKRRKPFRVPAGFARKDLKSRVLYILHRQKGEPLEVNALEAQAQVKRDQHEDYVQLLSQMEQSGEIWRRRNSVALTDGQKFVKARIVSINEKFGFARPEPKEERRPSPAATRISISAANTCWAVCRAMWSWCAWSHSGPKGEAGRLGGKGAAA